MYFYSIIQNMKKYHFYSKITFICNILFCICLYVRSVKMGTGSNDMIMPVGSAIIILGWFVAPVLTFAENIYLFWLFIRKHDSGLPAWRIVATVIFLTAQIFVHLIMPA
jgi:hypothetical protein